MSAMQAFADLYSGNLQEICVGALGICAEAAGLYGRSCQSDDMADGAGLAGCTNHSTNMR